MNPNLEQGLPDSNPDPQGLTLDDHIEYGQQVEAGNTNAQLGVSEEEAAAAQANSDPNQQRQQQAVDEGKVSQDQAQQMDTAVEEGRMGADDSRRDGVGFNLLTFGMKVFQLYRVVCVMLPLQF